MDYTASHDSQKKIIFFTGYMGRGGAERVISILSDHYANKGWDVKIAMLLHSDIEYELNPKISVIDLSSPSGIKLGFLQTVKRVRNLVKAEKPDVVVSFMAQICIITGLAIKRGSVRFIMSERTDPARSNRSFIFRKLLERMYEKSDVLVVQSERVKNYFNKKIRAKSTLIANPIKVYAHTDQSAKRIVTAGRLVQQKNHKMLISSFAEIYKKHPEYSLTIYGDGPLRGELEEQIASLGLQDAVNLPGNVPDLHNKISDAEIFVLSSDYEGLSNALLEAMMMGFPVISTSCAGSDEIITNMENGILIDIGDTAALTSSLEKLIADEQLRKKLSENAISSVEYCKVEHIIEKWSETIEK